MKQNTPTPLLDAARTRRAITATANTNLITEEIRQRHEEAVRELLARFRV